MSMIDPKGSRPEPEAMAVIRRHSERYKHNGMDPSVTSGADEAIFDGEESVEFWKTIAGKSHLKPELSPPPQFRSGSGTIADSIAQILP